MKLVIQLLNLLCIVYIVYSVVARVRFASAFEVLTNTNITIEILFFNIHDASLCSI